MGSNDNQVATRTNVYQFIKRIGSGGQGSIDLMQRIRHRNIKEGSSGPSVVCKTEKRSNSVEARILGEILPPGNTRIPMFHEAHVKPEISRIFLEYCNGGDLHGVIHWHKVHGRKMPEGFIWVVLIHLAEALAHIHYGYPTHYNTNWKPVIHRDMKPANVFLTWPHGRNTYPDVLLGDFGLAAVRTDPGFDFKSHGGSYEWQPPEAPTASTCGDVWALGAIIHACCHNGLPPIKPMPRDFRHGYNEWCRRPEAKLPMSISDRYSKRLEYWMTKCLKKNWQDRVSSYTLATDMANGDGRRMRRDMPTELPQGSVRRP